MIPHLVVDAAKRQLIDQAMARMEEQMSQQIGRQPRTRDAVREAAAMNAPEQTRAALVRDELRGPSRRGC